MNTKNVIGTRVAVCSYETVYLKARDFALNGDRAYAVEAANTHVLALARSDSEFRAAIDMFDLICPDGMPLLWCLNYQLSQSEKLQDRVYGPTLMTEVLARSAHDSQISHFLLGGSEATLDLLEQRFCDDYPNTKIAGIHSPPFREWSEGDKKTILEKVSQSGANIIWVGLGCPKQEKWIADNLTILPKGVYFGVGAAFAFHAGDVPQAPRFLQKIGMEWAFRLFKEPKRLGKRYLKYNVLFVYYLVVDTLFSPSTH